jgi:glycogen debranching enzyme
MDTELLLSRAAGILSGNDTGSFIKPSLGQYPHQWNWDAAFTAIGLAHYDLPRARSEIRSLLSGQWRDGMVPHVVYHTGPSDYFPPPDFWQIEASPSAPAVMTSGITQPPLLATAARLIHERWRSQAGSLEFLRGIYPGLLAWHRWLHSARDPGQSGLAAIIHPWESGADNSIRWDRALGNITPHEIPTFLRKDQVHVAGEERPRKEDYDRYVHLIHLFRSWQYDPQKLYSQSPFLVQDVLFNALLHRADEDLRFLAVETGEPTAEIEGWLERTRLAFETRLWNEEKGLYQDYDLRLGAAIEENSCAAFVPLFAGLPGEAAARRLVEEHLKNPAEFAPGGQTRFYLPSMSMSSAGWEPRRYWRGPIWVIINWLVLHGLQRYGYTGLANQMREQTLELVARSGFREYYDPRDGSGCGARDFSWTAALTIDLIKTG